jgi:Domain of unknown function (DUF4326)
MPRRYQRTRKISADIPPDAIYVGRPTKWGNPFRVEKGPHGYSVRYLPTGLAIGDSFGHDEARRFAVEAFRTWALQHLENLDLGALSGRDLVCWCPLKDGAGNPRSCHADVLLELAKPMSRYAADTSVPVDRSRAEIESTLARYTPPVMKWLVGRVAEALGGAA